ncbi:hypothetical protein DIPPA_18667 [Diplonema papillatum]|nr:hypothetical protein DIPPA_18667 [Diplonema papillatum]
MTDHLDSTDFRVGRRWEKWNRRGMQLMCKELEKGNGRGDRRAPGWQGDDDLYACGRGRRLVDPRAGRPPASGQATLASSGADWRAVRVHDAGIRPLAAAAAQARGGSSLFPNHWDWKIERAARLAPLAHMQPQPKRQTPSHA